jgi:hypothetical protein
VSARRAGILLRNGGEIVLERQPARAHFRVPFELGDEELVHPYLAPAAAVFAHWQGYECFHAGALAVGGSAWGVLGDRESGKSTLLAWLALRGHLVFSDDMLVTDGRMAFAGPRSIDLREGAARLLGTGKPLGVVGARERWRITLGPVACQLPLAGWIFLSWGDDVALTRLSAGEKLLRLGAQRAVRLTPDDPARLLRLSSLPGWQLSRPRDLAATARGAELVLAALADAAARDAPPTPTEGG